MKISIIIPTWNGASVIADCLRSIYADSGEELHEVICVDNASIDKTQALITETFPNTKLIQQPVNLGYAGGVNAGIDSAQGEIFIVLNQDCIVQPGWFSTLIDALREYPQFGIYGCTILNSDHTIDHTGAEIQRPSAQGIHQNRPMPKLVMSADYVTGAAIAIRRSTWKKVGRFDEGFYPAYYEDVDYCYRARTKGIETAVTKATVLHLRSNKEWQIDPIRHTSHGYIGRYRFVSKHFDSQEIMSFFAAEKAAIEGVNYIDHAIGRAIAAQHTLRNLSNTIERRRIDLGDELSSTLYRQLQVGFTEIKQQSFLKAGQLIEPTLAEPSFTETSSIPEIQSVKNLPPVELAPKETILPPLPIQADWYIEWKTNAQILQELREQENELVDGIDTLSLTESIPEGLLRRFFWYLFKRLPHLLASGEELLWHELSKNHEAIIEKLLERIELSAGLSQHYYRYIESMHEQVGLMNQQLGEYINQLNEQSSMQNRSSIDHLRQQLDERIKLLEILMRYDSR